MSCLPYIKRLFDAVERQIAVSCSWLAPLHLSLSLSLLPSSPPPLRNKVAQFVGFQLIAHIFWAYFVSNKFHRSFVFVFVFHFHFHLHISITKIDGKVSDGAQAQLT